MNQKQQLRKEFISIRNNIKNKDEKSNLIFEKVKLAEEYRTAQVIAMYKSLPSEVDTTELIKYSLDIGKMVALPKIEDDEINFYKIDSLNKAFVKSEFGVEEPISNVKNYINKKEIDLVIVPGLCFDRENNRLGFGKGFYDKFLAGVKAKTFGICFEEQILSDGVLPIEKYDIKMKKIITDKNIYE